MTPREIIKRTLCRYIMAMECEPTQYELWESINYDMNRISDQYDELFELYKTLGSKLMMTTSPYPIIKKMSAIRAQLDEKSREYRNHHEALTLVEKGVRGITT